MSLLRPAPHVRCLAENDGAVLLDIKAGLYLSLNTTGMVIWRAVEAGLGRCEIVDQLRGEAGQGEVVDDPRIESDVDAFLSLLQERGLVHGS